MTVTSDLNSPEVQALLAEANQAAEAPSEEPPVAEDPLDTVFQLAAGYIQQDGSWATEFEVRELTGRDEEALARSKDARRFLIEIISRGLVRVGNDEVTPEVLDALVGGDWETVLLAIRAVTFGPTITMKYSCRDCSTPYEADIDLIKDVDVRRAGPDDMTYSVQGRRTTYQMSMYLGRTQRQIYEKMMEPTTTTADLNTLVLFESIQSINGRPPLTMDDVRDLPMADRRILLREIAERRVGPDLEGVTTRCPSCGSEQPSPLRADILFR